MLLMSSNFWNVRYNAEVTDNYIKSKNSNPEYKSVNYLQLNYPSIVNHHR